jgi:hypothetical protein
MKSKIIFFLAWVSHFLIGFTQSTPSLDVRQRLQYIYLAGLYPTCPDYDQYVPIYQDEYNGPSLDQWFWKPLVLDFSHAENGVETKEWNSINSLSFPTGSNMMRITTSHSPIDARGISFLPDNYSFNDGLPNRRIWEIQSGAITSRWKFGLGRYVLRCDIPEGRHMWPAFWLSGICADEIDIFEFMQDNIDYNHDRKISCSVHTEPICGAEPTIDTKTYPLGYNATTTFHNYGCDWDDFKIVFYVDGQIKRVFYHYWRRRVFAGIYSYQAVNSCDDIQSGETYFEDPQFTNALTYIVINSAVRVAANNSQFPKYMDIDRLDVYDLMDCQTTRTIQSFADIEGVHFTDAYGDRTITAGNIVISPSTSLILDGPQPITWWNPGDLLVLTAAEEIKILPGFDVNWEGNLIGQIRSCSSNKMLDSTESPFDLPIPVESFFVGDSVSIDGDSLVKPFETPCEYVASPNPVTEFLQIQCAAAARQLMVVSVWGRIIPVKTEVFDQSIKVYVSNLLPGAYVVRFLDEKDILRSFKFIKL